MNVSGSLSNVAILSKSTTLELPEFTESLVRQLMASKVNSLLGHDTAAVAPIIPCPPHDLSAFGMSLIEISLRTQLQYVSSFGCNSNHTIPGSVGLWVLG